MSTRQLAAAVVVAALAFALVVAATAAIVTVLDPRTTLADAIQSGIVIGGLPGLALAIGVLSAFRTPKRWRPR